MKLSEIKDWSIEYNDTNHILSLSGFKEINELFRENKMFFYSLDSLKTEDASSIYDIEATDDKRIIVFYNENENIKAWMFLQDYWAIQYFIVKTNAHYVNFGYITSTHSPVVLSAGVASATNFNGYRLWIKNYEKY